MTLPLILFLIAVLVAAFFTVGVLVLIDRSAERSGWGDGFDW